MLEKRNLNIYSHAGRLKLDTRKGVVSNQSGTRLVAVSEDFLRGFVAAIENEVGPATKMLLRKCGFVFGERLARRFESEVSSYAGTSLTERPISEFGGLLLDLWVTYGYGDLQVDWKHGPSGFLPVRIVGSPMQDIGPKGHVSDDLFAGVLQGFFSHFIEPNIRVIQSGDVRLGSKDGTTFIITTDQHAKRVEQMVSDRTPHNQIVTRLQGGVGS
ncbi:MAG: hypothetical protein JNM40_08435 [Myxococcales bacterium]|nr:hypothetical protein [Myxococcales bacterium]